MEHNALREYQVREASLKLIPPLVARVIPRQYQTGSLGSHRSIRYDSAAHRVAAHVMPVPLIASHHTQSQYRTPRSSIP
eukprot:2043329-Rhodomonas_salina.1